MITEGIISLDEFLAFKPIATTIPYPNGVLKDILGCSVWDWRDYDKIACYLREYKIWTIWELEDEFVIAAGVFLNQKRVMGFVVTECPYHKSQIGITKLTIEKYD